jgi:hypothetical protein
MQIRFVWQVLYGTRVYGEGEIVDADDKLARHALTQGHAVEYVPPVEVREAVSPAPAQARKAVRKGS